jgi:hypothetical protein
MVTTAKETTGSRLRRFFAQARRKLVELTSEEAKLKRMARRAAKEEERLAIERRLEQVRQEKYEIKRRAEQARTGYLKARHKRQELEKKAGGGNALTSMGKALGKLLLGDGKPKRKAKARKSSKGEFDNWI